MKKNLQLMASLLLVMFLFITCSKDDNIVAQYSLSIEVTPAEGGSVSPTVGSFDEGVSKTITATPVEGWEFVGWSGDITSVENPLTLTMDEIKNITAVFQPILYNKIIGKWDVNNLSSKPSSKKSSSKKDDTNSAKTTDGDCIVYSLVFNSDGTFILSLSSGEIQGAFYFDSVNSITLTNVGTLTNLSITSGTITFNLSLTNLCSIDGDADNDSDYEEGECVSFLNCNDGKVWRKQVENGYKYLRITNNITNIWLENFLFNTTKQCTQAANNKTNEFDVILLENDIAQMTYVLDDTPNGDVYVILSITADSHLSVKYDFVNDALDETDYYSLVSADSLNEYLNSYSECSQQTYVPDDNFEQALIDLGYDEVLDDYVLTKNINTVTELTPTNCGNIIFDITGIEDFTSLEKLNLNCSELSIIDLSANTALTELYLAGSDQLTNIDLSANTALTSLIILNHSQITNIDLSANTALTTLSLNNNQLNSIDVSSNTSLTWLQLNSNLLTSIDVSTNTALKILRLTHNQLTSIDVSKNTALTELSIYNNQLTTIDVSLNTFLDRLFVSDNQLTSIDVSANTALIGLGLGNNYLTNIDVSANTDLTVLGLKNNQLTSIDVSLNTALTLSLDLRVNPDLACIQVNQIQLNSIPSNWSKDADASYSLDCSNPNAGKTYVPDDNFEQWIINLGLDDVMDDYVLTSNIVGVESLSLVEAYEFQDLTGIEDFTALTVLSLCCSKLTSIDLSANTALTDLSLWGNPDLTCIQVNQTQLNAIPSNWSKDADASYSLDCSNIQGRLDSGETPYQIYQSDNSLLESLYGKTYQGGLIFYLNTTNGSGMIAAPNDQSTDAQWGCMGTNLPGAESSGIGSGFQNTIDIITNCTATGIAGEICSSLSINGLDDWYLPSKGELNLMYTNLHLNGFGDFEDGSSSNCCDKWYWSSTEFDKDVVWVQKFVDGSQATWDIGMKEWVGSGNRVRAVRNF